MSMGISERKKKRKILSSEKIYEEKMNSKRVELSENEKNDKGKLGKNNYDSKEFLYNNQNNNISRLLLNNIIYYRIYKSADTISIISNETDNSKILNNFKKINNIQLRNINNFKKFDKNNNLIRGDYKIKKLSELIRNIYIIMIILKTLIKRNDYLNIKNTLNKTNILNNNIIKNKIKTKILQIITFFLIINPLTPISPTNKKIQNEHHPPNITIKINGKGEKDIFGTTQYFFTQYCYITFLEKNQHTFITKLEQIYS